MIDDLKRLERDVSKSRAERVKFTLTNFLDWAGDLDIYKITTELLEEYQVKRLSEVARATVDNELTAICATLRNAGFEVRRPSPKQGRKIFTRGFRVQEMRAFFQTCEEHFPDYTTLFLTLYATGARPTEIVPSPRANGTALRKDDLDQDTKVLSIRTGKQRRGQRGSVREFDLSDNPELLDRLVEQSRITEGEFMFPSRWSIGNVFEKICAKAEIERDIPLDKDGTAERLRVHSFRHDFITQTTLRLRDIRAAQRAAGHRKITTTEIYEHGTYQAKVLEVGEWLGGVVKGCSQKKNGPAEEAVSQVN
jgi:integrase